ncbi:MAG TPA: lysylphosphatidylglycerol synthase domain-containing protein [Vicinamibacterales bacterium]|nr:lysylphosphatidylglycerol synthase domain-containing protein [Vicinamibacterales bacterium]
MSSPAPNRARLLNILFAAIGLVLLVYTVQRVGGWSSIVEGVSDIGWWFVPVVALGAFRMVCRTRAWMVCASDPQLRFADAFGAWIVSDAMGNLTPLGLLASEPTKILMIRSRISTVTSIASVTIENAFYTASVLIVLLSGTWLFLQRANVPAGLEQISEAIIVVVAILAVVGIWVVRARPAVISKLAPLVSKLTGKADAPAEAIRDVESRIYAVPQWPMGRLLHVASWEVMFHVAAVAEVFLILRLLVPDITVAEAFLLESAGRFVTVAFKFVPYRLGIDEIGSGAVATALGLPPAVGVTLALVRRIRILILNAAALLRLVR